MKLSLSLRACLAALLTTAILALFSGRASALLVETRTFDQLSNNGVNLTFDNYSPSENGGAPLTSMYVYFIASGYNGSYLSLYNPGQTLNLDLTTASGTTVGNTSNEVTNNLVNYTNQNPNQNGTFAVDVTERNQADQATHDEPAKGIVVVSFNGPTDISSYIASLSGTTGGTGSGGDPTGGQGNTGGGSGNNPGGGGGTVAAPEPPLWAVLGAFLAFVLVGTRRKTMRRA